MNRLKAIIGLCFLLASLQTWPATADHDHADHHDHHDESDEHDHEDAVVISADMAMAAGITVVQAGSGEIARSIEVFGRLTFAPEHQAHIHARFPGVVTQVAVNAGDQVRKGQLLAVIESNDSLRPYDIKAPLDGWVISRNTSVGEVTGDTPLFELVDDRQLWADLKIFPRQRAEVGVGQAVYLQVGEASLQGQVAALVSMSEEIPFVTARVSIDNARRLLVAGDLVQAQIIIEARTASVVVANGALQMFEEKPVVFVRHGDTYEPRPLVLGSDDGRNTEVLQGLEEGETYVLDNSYLIKADLEKAGAAHEH